MDVAIPDLSMSDALAQICADTRAETARREAHTPLATLRQRLRDKRSDRRGTPRSFGRALKHTASEGRVSLIAEIKKASPSAGLIRPDFDPAAIARAYADAGATCLSVLTEPLHFHGDEEHLHAAREAVSLPVLRKDFILCPWQVYESRAMGADCILLILAALTDQDVRELEALARALDMDVLVEVHNRRELDRALGLETTLIGINNRNLKTLQTSLDVLIELAPHVPSDRFVIAESGIRTYADIQRLAAGGAQSYLVGESLLRQDDIGAATRALLGT